MKISIIMPTLNEAANLQQTLNQLDPILKRGAELIMVDGGSSDNTIAIAHAAGTTCLKSQPGRAQQMNRGIIAAQGDILWFLHADSMPPHNADREIIHVLTHTHHHWGRFNVTFTGQHFLLPVIASLMNKRSCLTGIATGDQGIFVNKKLLEKMGAYADIPLMEDIELSKRLKKHSPPACLQKKIITSSRRWERDGILRTIFLMWLLRLLYFLGVHPIKLHRLYYQS